MAGQRGEVTLPRIGVHRILAVTLTAVTGFSAVHHSRAMAHHSQAMFAELPVWVSGTIVKYRPVDPHAMIELHESQANGPARKWIIEGPRRGRLERILANNGGVQDDKILKVGDRISVCGFPLKKDWDADRMYKDWLPEQGRFVHGQVFVMPDGRMQSWGPYGTIDNCVRRDDAAKTWISFLDGDPLAHSQWCAAMTYVRLTHHTPRAFVDEVNAGLAARCR
jgi:hypothetical protein